jgi:DNA-binding CsgD family transcriptional regulator
VGPYESGAVEGLIERDAELATVMRLLVSVGGGTGAVLFVDGAPGVGKSELLAAVETLAQTRGLGVLRARASEFESEMAFGVARQLLEPMLRGANRVDRRRLLDGLAHVGARALGLDSGEAPADRFAAIHGLYWLCANRCELGPLVVLVDDLQWADDPSLAWLGYLARRTRELAALVVLGLRSGDPESGRAELASLLADAAIERLRLRPLSSSGVAALVRSRLDATADEEFCLMCSELTGGNPMFVIELLESAREEGLPTRSESTPALRQIAPSAVGTSVLARLGRSGTEGVALAQAVAILGPGSEVGLAAELAQLDPETAELAADRLAEAQILAPSRPLEFFHPLIAAAVTEDLAPGARRLAHRRAATLVDRDGPIGRVAAHLLASAPAGDSWATERLCSAAREALDRGAPEIAASYLRRALGEGGQDAARGELLLMLGTAEWRAGQPDALGHLEQALAEVASDRAQVIAASDLLAFAFAVSDQNERGVEVLRSARAAMGDVDPALAMRLDARIARIGMRNEQTAPAAIELAESLRARLDDVVDPPVHLLVGLALYAARANRSSEAQSLAERAVACKPYPPPLDICMPLIIVLMLVECYDDVRRLCHDLIVPARRQGAIWERVGIAVWRACASLETGALADAEADARWALERAEGMRRVLAVGVLVRVLIERDALDAAEETLRLCSDPSASRSVDGARFFAARGRLRHVQGRLEEALDDLLESGRRCERLGLVMLGDAPWRAEAALVQAALGKTDEARRIAAEQLDLAREFGRPRMLGISLRVCGLVEDHDQGLSLLAEAVETLEHSESPLELAAALTEYGAALRRAGHRVEARTVLGRGLDLAHHLGARRISARARSELVAAGAKPRRDAITGRDALTAAELRVARLAAEGLTNRAIAQALVITTMTAKAHLSRTYRKLGITRRDQLADALAVALGSPGERSDEPVAVTS